MEKIKKETKHTAYFYIAIVVMLASLIVCYYHYTALQKTIEGYVTSGYELSQVLEYYPYTSLIPNFAQALCQFGIIAALLFVADSVLMRLSSLNKLTVLADLFTMEEEGCGCGCEECAHEGHDDEGVVVATAEPENLSEEEPAEEEQQAAKEDSETEKAE